MTRDALLRELALAHSLAVAALAGAVKDAERLAEGGHTGFRARMLQVIGNLRTAHSVPAGALGPISGEMEAVTDG